MTQNDILNSVAEQLEEAREIAIAEGRAEGHAEGRAEGLAEGAMEERKNNVRKMHLAGLDMKTISSILELGIEEIEEMLK